MVIKEIPADMSLEELKEAIEYENSSVVISNIFRLKRRDSSLRQLLESESEICLEIRGESIPESLTILKCIIPVHSYIPAVRICYKCDQFGYVSSICEKVDYLVCAGAHRKSKKDPYMETKNALILVVNMLLLIEYVPMSDIYKTCEDNQGDGH